MELIKNKASLIFKWSVSCGLEPLSKAGSQHMMQMASLPGRPEKGVPSEWCLFIGLVFSKLGGVNLVPVRLGRTNCGS